MRRSASSYEGAAASKEPKGLRVDLEEVSLPALEGASTDESSDMALDRSFVQNS